MIMLIYIKNNMETISGRKKVMTKGLKSKIILASNSRELEMRLNEWFEGNDYEIISITFQVVGADLRAFILYRE